MKWQFTDHDQQLELLLRSDQAPQSASAWVATSTSRNFRDVRWHSFPMREVASGLIGTDDRNGSTASKAGRSRAFRYHLQVPGEGSAALFGEAVYANNDLPYYLSTNVRIVGPENIRDTEMQR